MDVDITRIDLGFGQCYVIRADGVIAVDAGAPGKGRRFERGLGKASIPPRDVRLVVITHAHWDHIGSAMEIKRITGAGIAIHHREARWLETAPMPLSPGVTPWGRAFNTVLERFLPRIAVPPVKADLLLGDEGLSLAGYGVPGRILHTPGHSRGSVSVLLDTGDSFVGDLAMNRFPLRLSPGLPIFADDPVAVMTSWNMLLERGATTVYPAHGRPFPADVIRKVLS